MGLDMYLERRTHVQRWKHLPDEDQFLVTVTRGGKPYPAIDALKVSEVTELVAYWERASQIHKWFVDHVQGGVDDCEAYPVSREQLRELLTLVNDVLAGKVETTELPIPSGFGRMKYDDYFTDLEATKRQLEALDLNDDDARSEDYYRASW